MVARYIYPGPVGEEETTHSLFPYPWHAATAVVAAALYPSIGLGLSPSETEIMEERRARARQRRSKAREERFDDGTVSFFGRQVSGPMPPRAAAFLGCSNRQPQRQQDTDLCFAPRKDVVYRRAFTCSIPYPSLTEGCASFSHRSFAPGGGSRGRYPGRCTHGCRRGCWP